MLASLLGSVLGSSCRSAALPPDHGGDPGPGHSIVACGQTIDIGVPVVLWTDPGGYDAYSTTRRFVEVPAARNVPQDGVLRYEPGRVARDDAHTQLVEPNSTDLERLGEVVDQFVLHYDVCGASRQCFKILQDHRGLSVHFLLDVDGTIYQTLDLRDQAWHATKANPRSIGVEIAHIGGRPPRARAEMEAWYAHDGAGPRVQYPAWLANPGVRTPNFVARPARAEVVEGRIQGDTQVMYDFTPEQYASLVALAAGLCRTLPNLQPDAPRASDGRVLDHVLGDTEYARFQGILGHYHVQSNKLDPGVAFDWERFLGGVRAQLGP